MAIFNAYFDASGHPDATGEGSALFVSGWISTVEKWAKFERLWLDLLAENGLEPPFHMTDFQAGQGQYKVIRRDEARYRAFKNTAIALMTRYTHKAFSVGLVIPHLRRFYAEYEVPPELQDQKPFPWCAMHCMRLVYIWMNNRLSAGTAKPTDQIEIIFQQGDKDRGAFLEHAELVYRNPPTLTRNLAAVPFQACDYLAWEHRNWLKVRTTLPGAKPSYANRMLGRRLAPDSQLYADWTTLTRDADAQGWPKRG
jgi:hypothetical protein